MRSRLGEIRREAEKDREGEAKDGQQDVIASLAIATVLDLWIGQSLQSDQTFQGVKPGMTNGQAFSALCHSPAALTPWRLASGAFNGPRIFFKRPMRCSDWQYFKSATYWGVRIAPDDCQTGQMQMAVVNILNDRVVRIHEWCASPPGNRLKIETPPI
jgi:hypothetical protein